MNSPVQQTRISLLIRLQKGGTLQDWEEFTQFYWYIVQSWAKLYHCPKDMIEDIFQNTLIAVMGALPSFQHSGEPGCFRAWLKTIVKRRVYDYFRKYSSKETFFEQPNSEKNGISGNLEPIGWHEPEESELDRIWVRQLMHTAFQRVKQRVKPEKWEAFRRYVIYGEPVEEVSKSLGIRVGTIFQQKSHILELLRQEFIQQLQHYQEIKIDIPDSPEFQKYLRNTIEDYLQSQRELRDTTFILSPIAPLGKDLPFIRNLLLNNQIPSETPILIIFSDNQKEPTIYPLRTGEYTIGAVKNRDILLPSPGVSAFHAKLIVSEKETILIDMNSTNGTYVNAFRIAQWSLHSGDCIGISSWRLYYINPRFS